MTFFPYYLLRICTPAPPLPSLMQIWSSPLHTHTWRSAALEKLEVAEHRSGAHQLTLITDPYCHLHTTVSYNSDRLFRLRHCETVRCQAITTLNDACVLQNTHFNIHLSKNANFNATVTQCSWQLTMTWIHRHNQPEINKAFLQSLRKKHTQQKLQDCQWSCLNCVCIMLTITTNYITKTIITWDAAADDESLRRSFCVKMC